MLVLEDGVVVSVHADAIGEHLLLVVEKGVGAEVIREVDTLVHRRHASEGARAVTGGAIPEAAHESEK